MNSSLWDTLITTSPRSFWLGSHDAFSWLNLTYYSTTNEVVSMLGLACCSPIKTILMVTSNDKMIFGWTLWLVLYFCPSPFCCKFRSLNQIVNRHLYHYIALQSLYRRMADQPLGSQPFQLNDFFAFFRVQDCILKYIISCGMAVFETSVVNEVALGIEKMQTGLVIIPNIQTATLFSSLDTNFMDYHWQWNFSGCNSDCA